MQIVINIDEVIYKRILPYKDCPVISNLANDFPEITHAIANGVPLPKGHWIPSHIPESILDECSECGFSCGAFTFNYCPNCGAKMVKSNMSEIPTGSESEDKV